AIRDHIAGGPDHAAAPPHSEAGPGGDVLARVAGDEPEQRERPAGGERGSDITGDAGRAGGGIAPDRRDFAIERKALNLEQFQATVERVTAELRKVIIGQDDAVRYALVTVLCN